MVGDDEGEVDGVAEGSCTKVTCAVSPLQLLKSKLSQYIKMQLGGPDVVAIKFTAIVACVVPPAVPTDC
jgi:hypothetical protein